MEDVYLSTYMVLHKDQNKNQNTEIRYYFDETLPQVKLFTLRDTYCTLSQNIRSKLVDCMSPELKLLYEIALCFPEEIQKYIYSKMLNGDVKEEGMNIFYNKKSILESFEIYQTIVIKIGIDRPIAPLYTLTTQELPDVLEKIKQLDQNYFDMVMSKEDHKIIQSMKKDIQQYFVGYNACVLSDVDMREYKTAVNMGTSGFGLMVLLLGVTSFSEILGLVSCGASMVAWLGGSLRAYDLRNFNKRKIIGS